ncbi:MAG: hypothetical protein IIY58_03960, partial [Aeriscardovia sp.]|nr:hypothetical protein [Aeriscardovia sp.]
RLSGIDLSGKVAQITLDDVTLSEEELSELTGSTEEVHLIDQLNIVNDQIIAKSEQEKGKK